MKKVTQQWDDMLMDYLDGKLDQAQHAFVNESLQKDPSLQQRLKELTVAEDIIRANGLELPSKNFTHTVMGRLHEQPITKTISIKNGLLLLGGIFIVLSIAVILLAAGVFDQTTTVDLNNVSVTQKYIRQSLPSFSIDGKWLVNGIVLLNVVLAFLVLDRAVLKPLFQRRIENANL